MSEFNLARQGHYLQRKEDRTETAHWTALILTAQTGSVVTAAHLLGTEEDEKAEREEQAQKDVKRLIRRMRRAELKRQKERLKHA